MDTPRAKDLIKKGQIDLLKESMEQGVQEGSQTFDMVLFELYKPARSALNRRLSMRIARIISALRSNWPA